MRIVKAGPGLTVQDRGRPGRLHEGLPASGALVPELLAAANEALGNAPGDAALEVFLHPCTVVSDVPLTVAIDGRPVRLEPAQPLEIRPESAVAYVALPGGVDVPEVLGSRSTLLVAKLGGLEGRMLRAGDVLRPRASAPARVATVPCPLDEGPIRLVPGPDAFPPEALEALFYSPFRIARTLDRTGLRLEGPRLSTPGDRPFSAPMLRGAMQVSHDGTPIVLGPDHPTTGGYPVVATVVTADLGRLARRRPGSEIRFISA